MIFHVSHRKLKENVGGLLGGGGGGGAKGMLPPPPPPSQIIGEAWPLCPLLPTPMSWTIFHPPKTWLHARVLMSGDWQTVMQSSVHQRPDFRPGFGCQDTVRLLYVRQGFDARLLLDSCTIFHDPKTWLHVRVLMSGDWQTVMQSSVHQRPGFRSGFWCRVAVRLLYDLPCTKKPDFMPGLWCQATVRLVQSSMTQRPGFTSGFWCQTTERQLYNLLCTTDLASFQDFNVRQLSDTYTIFYAPNTCILMLLVLFCCWCHVTARQLYDLSCTKDLRCVQQSGRASSIGLFASRMLSARPKAHARYFRACKPSATYYCVNWYIVEEYV